MNLTLILLHLRTTSLLYLHPSNTTFPIRNDHVRWDEQRAWDVVTPVEATNLFEFELMLNIEYTLLFDESSPHHLTHRWSYYINYLVYCQPNINNSNFILFYYYVICVSSALVVSLCYIIHSWFKLSLEISVNILSLALLWLLFNCLNYAMVSCKSSQYSLLYVNK